MGVHLFEIGSTSCPRNLTRVGSILRCVGVLEVLHACVAGSHTVEALRPALSEQASCMRASAPFKHVKLGCRMRFDLVCSDLKVRVAGFLTGALSLAARHAPVLGAIAFFACEA